VVCKSPPAVDLDDGEPLTVRSLERGIAGDVDLPEREAELRLQRAHLSEHPLAQMTAGSVIDDDVGGYG
jgi:hypothetical protein